MGPSVQIARFLGIPIKLHWTFLLLIPLAGYLLNRPDIGWNGFLFFCILFILISICVIFHEYGHALAARKYGIETDDIILSPLFGVARIRKIPDSPFGEFIVAVAGPMMNIMIGFILVIYLQWACPGALSLFGHELYESIMSEGERVNAFPENFSMVDMTISILVFVNLGLVLFNLIPAFPMDGGRMFRAVLNNFMDKLTATRIATIVGQIISLLIIFVSIYYQQYGITLVGLFVYYMATYEFKMIKHEMFRNRFDLSEMIRTNFTKLSIFSTRSEISDLFIKGLEKNFLVFDDDESIIGILSKEKIIDWMADDENSYHQEIKNYIVKSFPMIDTNMKVDDVLQLMRDFNLSFLPVEKNGNFIGVLDRNIIYDYLDLQRKLILKKY